MEKNGKTFKIRAISVWKLFHFKTMFALEKYLVKLKIEKVDVFHAILRK